jgi:hypothetical protein
MKNAKKAAAPFVIKHKNARTGQTFVLTYTDGEVARRASAYFTELGIEHKLIAA